MYSSIYCTSEKSGIFLYPRVFIAPVRGDPSELWNDISFTENLNDGVVDDGDGWR